MQIVKSISINYIDGSDGSEAGSDGSEGISDGSDGSEAVSGVASKTGTGVGCCTGCCVGACTCADGGGLNL